MKKIIFLLLIIIVIAVFFVLNGLGFGSGFGIGTGTKNGNEDGTSKTITEQTNHSEQKDTEKEENNKETDTKKEETIIKISVVENDYFYENERISMDELMNMITNSDENLLVEIKDEQASKNAYESLIDRLDEMGIKYVEK